MNGFSLKEVALAVKDGVIPVAFNFNFLSERAVLVARHDIEQFLCDDDYPYDSPLWDSLKKINWYAMKMGWIEDEFA